MNTGTLLPVLIASVLALSSPGSCAELGGLLERVSSPDIQVSAIKTAEVPAVPEARDVPLTVEQRAMLVEASMTLEADMVEQLR